jgi:hypothetical protein
MTGKEIKNVTASVLAKLRNTAKSSGSPFQQVLQLYAIERFLYRISKRRQTASPSSPIAWWPRTSQRIRNTKEHEF